MLRSLSANHLSGVPVPSGAKQAAEKPLFVSDARTEGFAGAEARADFEALAAQLKLCPVTELTRISRGLSFSATCKAPIVLLR
jgi:hypothetical protein